LHRTVRTANVIYISQGTSQGHMKGSTMKRIITATVIAAGALLGLGAGTASAYTSEDAAFADALSSFNMGDLDADAAITLAHDVCDLVDSGVSMKRISRHIDRESTVLSSSDATMFVLAAVSSYCPVN
jgi:hypothetical protein